MNIKRFLLSPLYKLKYKNSSIALGAFISNDSILGSNLKICRNTFIINSCLGNQILIDKNSYICESKLENYTSIYSQSSLSNVNLGQYSYISASAKINNSKIGKFCSIGRDFICGMGIHPTNFVSTHPSFFSTRKQCGVCFTDKNCFEEYKNISIGHDVWIGARVFVNDGIQIGNGAIIGAGAVVVKDVPDYAIVGGVPAKVIRFRFADHIIADLQRIEWWNWSEERLQEAQPYFINDKIEEFIKANHQ